MLLILGVFFGLKCTLSCTFLWHRQCFASSCESRFKKYKALPRRAANINTPSSLWHKRQKQTLICTFYCFIHKNPQLSPSVSLSVVTHSKYFLSGLTDLKRSHYNLFRRLWLTACQLGLTDGCWIAVSQWVSWIFHLHKNWGREMQCTLQYSPLKAPGLNIQI